MNAGICFIEHGSAIGSLPESACRMSEVAAPTLGVEYACRKLPRVRRKSPYVCRHVVVCTSDFAVPRVTLYVGVGRMSVGICRVYM